MWKKPWRYRESFLIALILLIIGLVIEILNKGKGVFLLKFPINIIIGLSVIAILMAIHIFFRKKDIVKWLSSVPAAISAISLFALITLLLGFIPQSSNDTISFIDLIGLTHIKQSWVIIIANMYLLVSLGLVTLNRLIPFSRKNIGFLLNHAGLWLTLMAVTLGSGDLQRLKVALYDNGKFVSIAFKEGHQFFALPFSLKLLDFTLEMYNPSISITDTIEGNNDQRHGVMSPLIEKGSEYLLQDWRIEVKEMIPKAKETDSGYFASNGHISSAVAYINAVNIKTGESTEGWLSTGNMLKSPKRLQIEGSNVIYIKKPEPKKYASSIVITNRKGMIDTVLIEVNKPFKTRGWSFYQNSYEEKMGHTSILSIIEAVYDPWLPLVYIGIFMMIAGSAFIIWLGRGVKNEH